MSETTSNMESSEAKLAAERHAAALRSSVEEIVDVVQDHAVQLGDYVTSFLSTLFRRS